MNQREFKNNMLRGLGRCVQAVQKEPESYRDAVLWGCTHNIAFDAQCEGTKAVYLYNMISCYPDKEPFVQAIAQSLVAASPKEYWKNSQQVQLLLFFAQDGDLTARQALQDTYHRLYETLRVRKRRPSGVFYEADFFDNLCHIVAINCNATLRIARDIGKLYLEKPFYCEWVFDWFYSQRVKHCMKTLERKAEKSPEVRKFLEISRQREQEECSWKTEAARHVERVPENPVALSVWLKRKADDATRLKYAQAYLDEKDPEKRADALRLFSCCPFPLSPEPVIRDCQSGCGILRETAWQALENISHPLVRKFALDNLNIAREEALSLFARCAEPSDIPLLTRLVSQYPAGPQHKNALHGVFWTIEENTSIVAKIPQELWHFIYSKGYCANCRERFLRAMKKYRMLTNEILQECLYDSSEDIRAFAKKALRRRNINTTTQL